MPLSFAAITPHPPIIIPEVGGPHLKEVEETVSAMQMLGSKFASKKPETVFLISPHSYLEMRQYEISKAPQIQGDLSMFQAADVTLSFENDLVLLAELEKKLKTGKLPFSFYDHGTLDHGAVVPLYYFSRSYNKFKVMLGGFSGLSLADHFRFGKKLGEVFKESTTKIGFVASGDLSHRLTPDAPAGYNERGKEFDEELITMLQNKDINGILQLDQDLIEAAGECGLRSVVILLGVLDETDYEMDTLSYEGPFGVGYLVAEAILNN